MEREQHHRGSGRGDGARYDGGRGGGGARGGGRGFGGGGRGLGGGGRGFGGGERGFGGRGRGFGGGDRGDGGRGRGGGGGRGQGRGRGYGMETRDPLVAGATRSMQQLGLTAVDAGKTVVPSVAESEDLYTPRRKVGTKGRRILLDTNFFKINLDFRVVNHYDIAISTEPKNKRLRREIIETMCNTFPNVFGDVSLVYDGMKNVYTSGDIRLQEAQQAFSVKLNNRKNPYEVKVQLSAKINLLDLKRFLKQEQDSYEQSCISVLDVVLRQLPMETSFNIGKYFYTYFDNVYYGPGLQQWHGYFQSVRPGWKYAFIQMDTSTRIFHKEQTLIQFLCELLHKSEDDLKRVTRFERNDMREINEKLDGLSIVTTHLPYPASYRLIGLGRLKPSDQKFSRKLDNGQTIEVSVEKHFQETYNMRLRFPNLPCVRAHPPDGQRYFPIELCNVKSGQQYRKLTERQKAQLIKASAKPANERRETIKGMITARDYENDNYVNGFGMSVNTNMTQVIGRVLDPPTLLYNNKYAVTPQDGSWRADRCTYFEQITVKQLAVLVCCNMHYDVVQHFIEELQRIGMGKGLKLPKPSLIKECINFGDVEAELTEMKRRFPELQLCLAILPSDSSSKKFYCELKRAGDTILGLTTQIVKESNVEKCNTVTISNICLKINAKLGGINNVIAGPHQQLTIVMKEPVIIFGADVTHPSPQNRHYPSVAAVVASFDQHAAKYDTVIGLQEYKKEDHEIIAKMNSHVKKLLINFNRKAKAKPTKIIFYRDGVSEGEFDQVLKREMTAIQQACTELEKDYKPKITLIVVQKRHHARFFPTRQEDESGRARNIPPGTVVDTDITSPLEFDYYLNSHQGIQGTCKPAHYNVLWDDSNFTADELYEMSYQLCHLYARCTRSVSIPAPAYYAHLVAFRARAYLDSMPDTAKLLDSGVQSVEALLQDINNRCQPHANMPGMYFA